MKTKPSTLLIAVLAIVFCSCNAPEKKDPLSLFGEIDRSAAPNTLAGSEKNKGLDLLFDGVNTTGWHGYNTQGIPDSWIIEDAAFTMITEGGGESQDIITDKTYKNFAFSVEFKLTPGANSGIIFQVAEDTVYKFQIGRASCVERV